MFILLTLLWGSTDPGLSGLVCAGHTHGSRGVSLERSSDLGCTYHTSGGQLDIGWPRAASTRKMMVTHLCSTCFDFPGKPARTCSRVRERQPGPGQLQLFKGFSGLSWMSWLLASYWPREVTRSTESKSGRGLQGELAKSLEIGRGGELRAFL